jgi:hypothetical protein
MNRRKRDNERIVHRPSATVPIASPGAKPEKSSGGDERSRNVGTGPYFATARYGAEVVVVEADADVVGAESVVVGATAR